MRVIRIPPSQRRRRGVTLLELLVVLVLTSVAAAVVAPAFARPSNNGTAPSDLSSAVVSARRVAVRRGEPVRFHVAQDGVWALVVARDGTPVSSGRVDPDKELGIGSLDVRIDAMGTCTLNEASIAMSAPLGVRAQRRETARAFDPLRCAFAPPTP